MFIIYIYYYYLYSKAPSFLAPIGKYTSTAGSIPAKNRPRIPTPDVTKEVVDRENRLAAKVANMQQHFSEGVAVLPNDFPPGYPHGTGDTVVSVFLQPIQELDGTGSVNNTLHAGQPGTAALAQAILSPGTGLYKII